MSVGAWNEVEGSRKITQTADATTATRLFQIVTTDMVNDSEYDVLTAAGAPEVGDFYGDNALLRVQTVDVVQVGGEPLNWLGTVTFSTSVPEDKDELFEDPPARPPEVSIVQVKSTEPVHIIEDFFNRTADTTISLQNTAGVSYDPPIEREVTDIAITVVQNFADFRPNDILGFRGAVNNEVWETFDRGQARIVDIQYVRATVNGVNTWKRTVEIHVRDKTADYNWPDIYPWQVLRKNEGVQQLTATGDDYEPIILASGGLALEPIGLTSLGIKQAATDTPTFLRWDIYDQKNFADLDIRLT